MLVRCRLPTLVQARVVHDGIERTVQRFAAVATGSSTLAQCPPLLLLLLLLHIRIAATARVLTCACCHGRICKGQRTLRGLQSGACGWITCMAVIRQMLRLLVLRIFGGIVVVLCKVLCV